MNEQLTPEKIRQLSVAERLRLIEDVWTSLSEAPEKIEVPEWHRAELEARLAAHELDPFSARPWAEVKANILRATRK
jgi:putative addiction module component (TIGR02574 family)